MDLEALVSEVGSPITGCTQQDVELVASQVWMVSSSAASLPLQIEDASRPEKSDVSKYSIQFSEMQKARCCVFRILKA